ncbi:MAG TPA: polysaccharide deacetylase family protein [Povalibacter sp.]|uniref:polysaccharide deacetylase family protein n=1 Tax=Povalibacter sp. TaxID=1962978 RepID=UPI002C7A9E55|nr:polysaccharide deacetylase family protein [Povalibacter sp.]HMN42968.1 polysaccharide deacetylase family protein [Povalibacter sp.]
MSIRNLGISAALQSARLLTRNRPRIVMYHRFGVEPHVRKVSAAAFEVQLQLIRQHYHSLSYEELLQRLADGSGFPANSVVLTIDDAYEDVYTIAMPLLLRWKVPAIVYAPSAYVDRETWLWPDAVRYMLFTTVKRELRLELAGVEHAWTWDRDDQVEGIWNVVADVVKTFEREDCLVALEQMSSQLAVPLPTEPVAEYRAMTWEQLRAWQAAGLSVGSHTRVHPNLSRESRDTQAQELFGSKQRIEEMLQKPCDHFCYPFGGIEDFTKETVELVAKAGYRSAVTTVLGMADGAHLLKIPRFGASESFLEFRKTATGWRGLSHERERWLRPFSTSARPVQVGSRT